MSLTQRSSEQRVARVLYRGLAWFFAAIELVLQVWDTAVAGSPGALALHAILALLATGLMIYLIETVNK